MRPFFKSFCFSISLVILLLLAFTSCTPQIQKSYFVSQSQVALMDDTTRKVSASIDETGYSFQGRGSYTNGKGIMVRASFSRIGHREIDFSHIWFKTKDRFYYELQTGYANVAINSLVDDRLLGFKLKGTHDYFYYHHISSKYHKLYFFPALGIKTKRFDIGFGVKTGLVHYRFLNWKYEKFIRYGPDDEQMLDFGRYSGKQSSHLFFEPTLNMVYKLHKNIDIELSCVYPILFIKNEITTIYEDDNLAYDIINKTKLPHYLRSTMSIGLSFNF